MRSFTHVAAILGSLLLLGGCIGSRTYEEQVTYRVDEIAGTTWARLNIHGPAPGEPMSQIRFVSAKLDDVPADVEVGDLLSCRVHQHRKNLADANVTLTVDNCRHR